MARAGCAVTAALKAFEPATRGAVAPGFAVGSRFKGSVRNGLNGAVGPGFAVSSWFKRSVRDGLNGTVGPGFAVGSRFKGSVRNGLYGVVAGFAVGSRFKGSVRNGLNDAVGPRVGAPCGWRGARGPVARARLVCEGGRVGGEGRIILPRMNADERG
jgi:hypothetical protein